MANEPQYLFSQIDVATAGNAPQITVKQNGKEDISSLLRELIIAQHRQNELLEEVVEHMSQAQRQRMIELAHWKKENPQLAKFCKSAADKLNQVQTDYITSLTEEIDENIENIQESEYYFNEFIDRYGPRFMHLSSMLQVLAQLGNAPDLVPTQSRK
ncbi:MAG: hypothetical protein Q4C95_05375 [Planctomycetia bacterium]|nr:hypothetical protein [Planctomycetia bacterium]